MKKGLLLSVVASGLIYAGGDIAPAQPVAPQQAAPAACDFWGTLALRYDANKDDATGYNFGDSENNYAVGALAMGVEKQLGYGFGFGAELDGLYVLDGNFNKAGEVADLMQAYLTYKNGNTAVKMGRQALPKAISPWVFTDRDALGGIPNRTYNGITVVNTSLPNTTLVGGWVASVHDFGGGDTQITGDDTGLWALGAVYKGISNTTLSGVLYYIPSENGKGKAYSAWAAVESKINSVNVGLQLAYAKADPYSIASLNNNDNDASYGIAAYAGTKYNAFDVKLTLAYLNDGDASLSLNPKTAGELISGFWGASYHVMGGNVISGNKQTIARLDMGYTLANKSRIYGGVAVDSPDHGDTAYAARVGYDFTIKGVNAKVEYRYHKGFDGLKDQRIRVQGVYKF